MALEDIRDNLKDQFGAVFARVRESSAFIDLAEKYHALPPAGQKIALAVGSLLAFLIVMALPYAYYSGSSDLITQYEDKRQLVQDVYHVSRAASAAGAKGVSPVTAEEFKSRAQSIVTEASLQPDQLVSVPPIPTAAVPGIAKTIDQAGVEVTLKKLNLTQVIDIGYKLQVMDPQRGRLMGIDIKANTSDRHFFDVVYRVIGFGPKPEGAAGGAGGAKRGKGK